MVDSCFGVSFVPTPKSADFETERQGDFPKISLPVGGGWLNNAIVKSDGVHAADLRCGYHMQAVAEAYAEAAYFAPPRRAHDTLQPQDESIIVGYYTSAEVHPQRLACLYEL